jgi:hypothetical protein
MAGKKNENGVAGEGSTKGRGPGRRKNGSSIQGYFRALLDLHPEWVEERSNDPIFAQWLADNPGATEVPQSVKNGLSNVKSSMRNRVRKAKKKTGKRGRPRKIVAGVTSPVAAIKTKAPKPVRTSAESLEALEEQIDDALSAAKRLGREDLHQVVVWLKRARNAVVLRLGE